MKTSKKWLVLTLAFTMLCLLTACGNDNKANGNVNGATAGTNNTGNNKEQNGTTDTDSTPTNSPTGAGTNNIPKDKCSEQGIVVFNTPGANANAVKELVIAGLLLSNRKIIEGYEWAKTLKGNGAAVGKMVEKGKSQFVGPEIKGKTLGVIGLGAIGILVANAAVALGMNVIGFDPFMSVGNALKLAPTVKLLKSAEDVMVNCDYLTIHVPLTDDTRDMVDADMIAKMKDGVRILNFSRDGLVNSTAVLEAVKSGKVAKYVTDFGTDDILGEENIICLPHLGASTPESEENCAVMACDQVKEYLENGNIINSVNYPAISLARTNADDTRFCVAHKNVPELLKKVLTQISGNVENMLSKSRGDYAYTIIDVAGAGADDLAKIAAVDGVIRVRAI